MSDDMISVLANQADRIRALEAALETTSKYVGVVEDKLGDSHAEAERLRELLVEVRDRGLIYWEPITERGHVAKADMAARINKEVTIEAPVKEEVCPFCGLDPYHYEDVGTAFPARVAIVCCDAATAHASLK